MGKSIGQKLDLWTKRANKALVLTAGLLIALMAFLAAYGSVRRYLFQSPEAVSYELSKMFLLLSFVLAIAAVEMQDRFLRCDLLLERFPDRFGNIVSNILSPFLGIVFFGIITWISASDALRAFSIDQHSQSSWPVPLYPVKLAIPLGYGFLCVVLIMRLLRGLHRAKTSAGEEHENDD